MFLNTWKSSRLSCIAVSFLLGLGLFMGYFNSLNLIDQFHLSNGNGPLGLTSIQNNCTTNKMGQKSSQSIAKSTLCSQLLNDQLPNIESEIPPNVVPTLLAHCRINPSLPLEALLPNMPLFAAFHSAIQNYKREYNATIILFAGRGTTGTRGVVDFVDVSNFATLHYLDTRGINQTTTDCYKKFTRTFIRRIAGEFRNHIFDDPDIQVKDYQILYGFIEEVINHIFRACKMYGNTGNVVLSDTPWVNLFTELYLAAGPETKVVLLTRNAMEWAAKRQKGHGRGLANFVCRDHTFVADPFSYTQCKGPATYLDGITQEELAAAFVKYNLYVSSLVPNNHLLTMNVFSSKTLKVENSRVVWSKLNVPVLNTFLTP